MKDHSKSPRKAIVRDTAATSDEHDEGLERAVERRSQVRRWRATKWAFWLSVPLLIVWMAPTIVGYTSLHDNLVRNAIGPFDGELKLGGASLGWLSPIRLRDVVLRDAQGRDVVVVPRVESERTLLGLLTHSSDPGLFRVIEPQVNLQVRPDGSNLEDILASFPKKESSGGSRPDVALEVVDGTLVLEDAVTGVAWRAERLLARVTVPGDPLGTLEVKLETRVVPDGGEGARGLGVADLRRLTLVAHGSDDVAATRRGATRDAVAVGTLAAELRWTPAANGPQGDAERGATSTGAPGAGQIQVAAESLPLEVAGPLLRRFVEPTMQLGGALTLRGNFDWSSAANATHSLSLESLDVRQLDFVSAKYLGRDRLRIPQLNARGEVRLAGQNLEMRDVELDTGFARLQASGSTSVAQLASKAAGLGAGGSYDLRGELDLARLSQLLPDTLRVREGTEIESGKLTVSIASHPAKSGQRWEGKLESSPLVARNLGKRVTWDQPIRVQFAAEQDDAGFVIERLDCVSSFLQAEARGTLDDGQLTLNGDLQKLAEELDQFVDLGSSELSGRMRGELAWRRQANDQIDAQGEIRLEQLQLAFGKARPWREELLVAKIGARAIASGASISRLETADVRVTAGADTLQLALTEPVAAPSASAAWPVQGRLVGHLERWLPRVQMWLPMADWTLAGAADLTFAGRVSTSAVQCDEGKLNLTNLQARGPGWNIVEPQVKIELAGEWNRAQGRLQSPGVTFTSSAMAMRAENISVQQREQGPQLAATVGLRADMNRLASWKQEAGRPATWGVGGMTVGQVKLAHAGAATTAEWSFDVENLVYAVPVQATVDRSGAGGGGPGRVVPTAAVGPTFKTVWQEPKIKLTGQGQFDGDTGTLDVERFDLSADDLQVIAKGKVTELTSTCVVDLQGELGYDLESLTSRFRQQLGPSVEIRGRDSQPFVLRGPLMNVSLKSPDAGADPRFASTAGQGAAHWPPAELAGEAGLRWEAISAFGLPIGPGEIQGKLEQGAIDFKPLDVKVSEGQLRLAPRLVFEDRGPVLIAQPGQALDSVRISPEMCALWLKFVLPILAETAQVDGRLSLALEEVATVPVAAPLDGEVRGTLDVRSMQVGPGPLSREIISVAQMVQALVQKQPAPAATDTGSPQAQKTWVEMPAQQVPFHWKDHRVYHEGLQMAVKDVVLVTRGSVGVDQTIDLLAEVPVRDEWLASNRYLQSLKGQRLQIPITGTLTAPRVDRRVFQQISSQAITGAARGVLDQEVSRGLDKLFKPRGETPPPGGAAPGAAPAAGKPMPPTTPSLPFIPKFPFQPQ